MELDRRVLVCKVMSEKDIIENKDKKAAKAQNTESEDTDSQAKPLESKKPDQ